VFIHSLSLPFPVLARTNTCLADCLHYTTTSRICQIRKENPLLKVVNKPRVLSSCIGDTTPILILTLYPSCLYYHILTALSSLFLGKCCVWEVSILIGLSDADVAVPRACVRVLGTGYTTINSYIKNMTLVKYVTMQ